MSDDRELLELAARAIGIDLPTPSLWATYAGKGVKLYSGIVWNPLDNDGDALQLAVRVGIDIHQNEDHVAAVSDYFGTIFSEDFGNDPCAATRRAIVRAAADVAQRRG